MNPFLPESASSRITVPRIITEFSCRLPRQTVPLFVVAALITCLAAPLWADDRSERERFSRAWWAAAHGKRPEYRKLMAGLNGYLLFPYLQYEDLRFRRSSVKEMEMADFLEAHAEWAFAPGLKKAWLRTLGERGRWDSLLRYAPGSDDTEVRCHLARARIVRGETEGLMPQVQQLWAVGKSQPDACDPAFAWLIRQGGVTSGLAWERIRRAMQARQPRLTRYLARFLAEEDRVWADRWYQQDRGGYRQLRQARNWTDVPESRDITSYGIRRLARNDPDRAWQTFEAIRDRFEWPDEIRGEILRDIAMWSAFENAKETPERMDRVPDGHRDGKLLEWRVRFELAAANWGGVVEAIDVMPDDQKDDARWRYWRARARLESGKREEAASLLSDLALEANYYGFLAADGMDLPYTICPEKPTVTPAQVEKLRKQAGFQRALELRAAGVPNWSRSEWTLAERGLDVEGLRVAAALAHEEDWPDMAIFALGNSGDLRWYEWRFPVEYAMMVETQARDRDLDPSWIFGLMRSESAMAEDAVSPAGARGLMQVMPGTAKAIAKRNAFTYTGHQQLMQAEDNIRFGTTYLRELMDRFGGNEVLVSGAYNAGPHVVERWLKERPAHDPAVWVETLPYFETRDYIPRVLAFSTIYDWRLGMPVSRISTRMPEFDSGAVSGTMRGRETAEVVCRTPG